MILFITRKYPPSVGGMEQLSFYLTTGVADREPVRIIKWGGSQKWLPFFVIFAVVRALWLLATQPVDLIHMSDLVLAPVGWFLRLVGRRPVVANAHGLDVIYPNRLYQAIVLSCARRLDRVICNSEHTRRQCVKRGIAEAHTCVIPAGIAPEAFRISMSEPERSRWRARWGIADEPSHILLTVGRLVPRKGVYFFVTEVLPRLAKRRSDWAYLVIGDGPERQRIAEATWRDESIAQRVHLLGQVPDDELGAAYAAADLFVMPNVAVLGDSEGFGIVTLEARAAGLSVVASDVDGIADSFSTAEAGFLVPPGDAVAFVDAIERQMDVPLTPAARLDRSRQIAARYGWTRIIADYLDVFRSVRAQVAPNRG